MKLLNEINMNNSDIFIAAEFLTTVYPKLKTILSSYEVIIIANHRAYLQRERSAWAEYENKLRQN